MRLFLGVFPPAPVQRDVHRTLQEIPAAPRLRWTAPERLHFTLHFLGEVDPSDAPRLQESLAATRLEPPRITVELGGLDGFPNLRRPRVLFVPLRRGGKELEAWHAETLGTIPPDLRPEREVRFRPHLTVARPRQPLPSAELRALRTGLAARSWRFEAAAVDLVRSHLGGSGARYERLFRLAGA